MERLRDNGLQYILEVQKEGDLTVENCGYICSLCSKKMSSATLLAHVKSVPHRLKFTECFCPDLHEKFGKMEVKQWTASLVKEFTSSLQLYEKTAGRQRLAVTYEKSMNAVVNLLKSKVDLLLKKENAEENKRPPPAVKAASPRQAVPSVNNTSLKVGNAAKPSPVVDAAAQPRLAEKPPTKEPKEPSPPKQIKRSYGLEKPGPKSAKFWKADEKNKDKREDERNRDKERDRPKEKEKSRERDREKTSRDRDKVSHDRDKVSHDRDKVSHDRDKVSRDREKQVPRDQDKMVPREQDKVLPRDQKRVIPREQERMIPREQDRMIPREQERMVPREQERMVPREQERMIPREQERMIPREQERIPREQERMIPREQERMIPREQERMIPREQERMIPREQERMIPREQERMIPREQERMIPRDQERMIPRDQERMIPRDQERMIPREQERMIPREQERMIPRDQERMFPRDQDKEKSRERERISRDRDRDRRKSKDRDRERIPPFNREHELRPKAPRRESPRRRRSPSPLHDPLRKKSRTRSPVRGDRGSNYGRKNEDRRPPPHDFKIRDFRDDENRLKNEHKKLMDQYTKDPESHPRYKIEWERFWDRRYREVKQQGLDINRYDFKLEWLDFWPRRLRELCEMEYKDNRNNLLARYKIDDPDRHRQDDLFAFLEPHQRGNLSEWSEKINKQRTETRGGMENSRNERPSNPWENPNYPRQNVSKEIYEAGFSVIGTLKLLTNLEDQLGSLYSGIEALCNKALKASNCGKNAITLFEDDDNVGLLRLASVKLSSQISSGILDVMSAAKTQRAVESMNWLMKEAEMFNPHSKSSRISRLGLDLNLMSTATIGMNTVQIAQYIAQQLFNIGKSDVEESVLQDILKAISENHTKYKMHNQNEPSYHGVGNVSALRSSPMDQKRFLHDSNTIPPQEQRYPTRDSQYFQANSATISNQQNPSLSSAPALFPSGAAQLEDKRSISQRQSSMLDDMSKQKPKNSALSLLQTAYDNEDDTSKDRKDMDSLSLEELQELLSNFKKLNPQEQQNLTSYLKKLEATDNKKVTKLRSMMQNTKPIIQRVQQEKPYGVSSNMHSTDFNTSKRNDIYNPLSPSNYEDVSLDKYPPYDRYPRDDPDGPPSMYNDGRMSYQGQDSGMAHSNTDRKWNAENVPQFSSFRQPLLSEPTMDNSNYNASKQFPDDFSNDHQNSKLRQPLLANPVNEPRMPIRQPLLSDPVRSSSGPPHQRPDTDNLVHSNSSMDNRFRDQKSSYGNNELAPPNVRQPLLPDPSANSSAYLERGHQSDMKRPLLRNPNDEMGCSDNYFQNANDPSRTEKGYRDNYEKGFSIQANENTFSRKSLLPDPESKSSFLSKEYRISTDTDEKFKSFGVSDRVPFSSTSTSLSSILQPFKGDSSQRQDRYNELEYSEAQFEKERHSQGGYEEFKPHSFPDQRRPMSDHRNESVSSFNDPPAFNENFRDSSKREKPFAPNFSKYQNQEFDSQRDSYDSRQINQSPHGQNFVSESFRNFSSGFSNEFPSKKTFESYERDKPSNFERFGEEFSSEGQRYGQKFQNNPQRFPRGRGRRGNRFGAR